MEENKRIVEIDGVKIEVDLRSAKRVDTFRVGDNVKVLCEQYEGKFDVKPGIITDFVNFKEKPTIVVAIFNEGGWSSTPSISFINIHSDMDDKYEICYASEEELMLSKDGVVEKFEREIQKKKTSTQTCRINLIILKNIFLKVNQK